MQIKTRRFETLDAMRGVAALAVVVHHFRDTLPARLHDYYCQSGYLAVDLFFVLSGFVIALSYDGKFAVGMTVGRFMEIRAVRLLPMIWLGVGLGGAYLFAVREYSTAELAAVVACNAFLLPYLGRGEAAPFAADGATWSLFFEWIANFVYACTWRWLSAPVLIGVVAVSAGGVAWSTIALGSVDAGWSIERAGVGFARVGFSFFLGVMLWRARGRWAASMPRIPAPVVLVLLALCLLPQFTGTARIVYDLGFVLILSPLLVMVGSVTEPAGGGVKAAEWLAAISYPLYVIHKPAQQIAEELASAAGVSERIAAIVAFFGIILASWWLAKYYDEPVRAFLRRDATPRAA